VLRRLVRSLAWLVTGAAACAGGGRTARCFGEPPACEDLNEDACAETLGCSVDDGGCTGMALACAALSASACEDQRGCVLKNGSDGGEGEGEGEGESEGEAEGEGEPEPTCGGAAVPCPALSQAECLEVSGCSLAEAVCTGTAERCAAQVGEAGCVAVDGCRWEDGQCRGYERPCDWFLGPTSCDRQPGCGWRIDCVGEPRPCEDVPVARCEQQIGCRVR
jgi:hypothetical protein